MDATAHKDAPNRAQRAGQALRSCKLCPRECGVDRTAGQKGYCGLDGTARCFREMLCYTDEEELTPSHHVYFAGCNLRCEFCVLPEWNEDPEAGKPLNVEGLAAAVSERRAQGSRSLMLLGGEPSASVHGALDVLGRLPPDTRTVWLSNMYFSPLVGELLDGLVDVYLADFKCGSPECARKILDAEDYVEVAQGNLLTIRRRGDVIVRYLVLPGHGECCLKPILRWVAAMMPEVKVSLRGDYVPPAEAVHAPGEYLDPDEFQAALEFAESLKLNLIR